VAPVPGGKVKQRGLVMKWEGPKLSTRGASSGLRKIPAVKVSDQARPKAPSWGERI